MTRHTFTLGAVVAAFLLSQAPAFGQAGSRPNPGGSTTGSAAPRGGDTGSSAGSTGSSGGGASSTSSGSSGSGTASSSSSGGFGSGSMAGPRERAPERPMAVPRGSAVSGGSTQSRPEGAVRVSPGEFASHAVPTYSRPREGRVVAGGAVDRADAPARPGGGSIIYYPYSSYYGYYGPYGYGFPGYGFGYGYFGYDPFWSGYGYGGYSYGAPSYSAGGYSSQQGTGKIRLRVQPANAQVYVDGYFVGTVDDFNGLFQRLAIDAGAHRIELRAEGYEPVEFEVFVTPGETITYRGEMKPRMP